MTGAGACRVFSDYLVFVDESGDHGLEVVAADYPVFVLLFVVISKDEYVDCVCRALQRFKFDFWGHDEVVLHEHEIRKPRGAFRFLLDRAVRELFQTNLSAVMASMPVSVIAVVIDKPAYAERFHHPANPYEYALESGLERVYACLEELGQESASTSIVVECRGPKEDAELELAFRRVCDGANFFRRTLPFQLVMVPKSANCAGLQLADLMARPIGVHHLRPEQPNRAFEIIRCKLRRSPDGQVEGWGIQVLP